MPKSLLTKKEDLQKLSQADFDRFIKRLTSMQDEVIRSANKTYLDRLIDRLNQSLKARK